MERNQTLGRQTRPNRAGQPKRRRDRGNSSSTSWLEAGSLEQTMQNKRQANNETQKYNSKAVPLEKHQERQQQNNLGTTCCCQGTPCVCRMHPTPRILPAQKRHRAREVKERPKTARLGLSGVTLPHDRRNEWDINPRSGAHVCTRNHAAENYLLEVGLTAGQQRSTCRPGPQCVCLNEPVCHTNGFDSEFRISGPQKLFGAFLLSAFENQPQ